MRDACVKSTAHRPTEELDGSVRLSPRALPAAPRPLIGVPLYHSSSLPESSQHEAVGVVEVMLLGLSHASSVVADAQLH
jgi:hypothetical protein